MHNALETGRQGHMRYRGALSRCGGEPDTGSIAGKATRLVAMLLACCAQKWPEHTLALLPARCWQYNFEANPLRKGL